MVKKLKKSYILLVILLLIALGITGCKKDIKEENKLSNTIINEENAKGINIENLEITNISSLKDMEITTKIENDSNFHMSNIWIKYDEIDKNENIISTSETYNDITLLPGEKSSIVFPYKKYTHTIKVMAYGYESYDKDVLVDLKSGNVQIKNNDNLIEESKAYEVLSFSEIKKESQSKDTSTYTVKVKNTSQKDLGNISLKIGELKEKEYIRIDHLQAYEVLKSSEEIQLSVQTTLDTEELEIIGYSYDDIAKKASIDIDLKSKKAKINK